jgi:hypothetical protein
MTCSQFDDQVADLARARAGVTGAGASGERFEAAGQHLLRCQRCAARLAQEESLSAALRAVAQFARQARAPESIEAALLAAFRAAPQAPPAQPAVEAAPGRVHGPAGRSTWAGLAAAATLALVSGAVAWTWWNHRPEVPIQKSARGGTPVAAVDVSPKPLPEPQPAAEARPLLTTLRAARGVATTERAVPADSSYFHWVPWTATGDAEDVGIVPASEIDTAPMVRIRVSHAALAALGVVDAGSGDPGGLLEADVIIGEDGFARAIRIVDTESEEIEPPEGAV